ncbi:MAG: T9SS type A sorting domain-containing protein [Bacteroidetes bacterium]|nr:T9SS type A sorting domain-containing protein [Bacteroidota bacterium]
MKKLLSLILIFTLWSGGCLYAQFRSGIFLHHSTGACIWGPNGSSTSVPQEMDKYNTDHGYIGSLAVTMNEEWWSPDDNEWVRWHAFFEDPGNVTGIGYYLPDNKIIVIKSCFPSSAMSDPGTPGDTIYPEMKTVYNYKWHWRHIINAMRSHPGNFFTIWTNAPLEPASTNADEAALSDWFCTWAKDTLAEGLDPITGILPANVYIFDYFHKLAGPDGMELIQYRSGAGDSHPNAAATELVAPQFVSEIFTAAIGYESIYGIMDEKGKDNSMLTVSPNPFLNKTLIRFNIIHSQSWKLELFNMGGNKLNTVQTGGKKGEYQLWLPGEGLQSGIYFLKLTEGSRTITSRLIFNK